MDNYVSKPLHAEALYAAIEGWQAVAGPAPQPIEEPAESAPLDEQELCKRFGDDPALLKEVAGVFVESCPTWQSEIRAAVDAGDAAKLRITAHTIKGAVGHFGVQAAYDAAHELEMMARDGQLHRAPAASAALNRALQRLQSVLRKLCQHQPEA